MIGERLKELRESKKLTKKSVAEQLKIDQTTYGKYELNKREPDVNTLSSLADFFEVTTDYLLGRESLSQQKISLQLEDLKTLVNDKNEDIQNLVTDIINNIYLLLRRNIQREDIEVLKILALLILEISELENDLYKFLDETKSFHETKKTYTLAELNEQFSLVFPNPNEIDKEKFINTLNKILSTKSNFTEQFDIDKSRINECLDKFLDYYISNKTHKNK
ncbi:MAG TPA: helix-turn-helix transcriptional regulator [Clostridia bacterium]